MARNSSTNNFVSCFKAEGSNTSPVLLTVRKPTVLLNVFIAISSPCSVPPGNRKIPHTATGEAPLFLFTGQEPSYSIDNLLPTLSRETWSDDDNVLDLSQLRTAYGLARKNLCLARRKSKNSEKDSEPKLKVGDRVYRQNFTNSRTKVDLKWLPGYRIVSFESSRTAVIEHSETGVKSRVNVRHLKWADAVSELINNSNIDTFPGTSKLYFRADDLDDLQWDALKDLPPLEESVKRKADQIVRDRGSDLTLQPEAKRQRLDTDSTSGQPQPSTGKRARRRNVRLQDYVVGNVWFNDVKRCKPHLLVRTNPSLVSECLECVYSTR